jgi:hypothetical protein
MRIALLLSVVGFAVTVPGCRLLSFTVACNDDSGCDPDQQCIDGACLVPRDPCSPDVDAIACSVGDADGDGTANGEDSDDADACVPDRDAPACESGDADGDGTANGDDADDADPCVPVIDVLACASGDEDDDGTENGDDQDDADRCVPDPDVDVTCAAGSKST